MNKKAKQRYSINPDPPSACLRVPACVCGGGVVLQYDSGSSQRLAPSAGAGGGAWGGGGAGGGGVLCYSINPDPPSAWLRAPARGGGVGGGAAGGGGVLCYSINPDPPSVCLRAPARGGGREAGVFPLGHERQRLLPAARVLQREHDAHHLVQGQVLGSTLPVQMLVQRQARGGQAQAFGAGQRHAGVNGAVHHRPDDVHLTVIEHLQVITNI